MKKVLGLFAFGVVAVGCSSPVQLCKDEVSAVCARVFECYDSATKASSSFVAAFGVSQTECNNKLQSNSCANISDSKPCQDSSMKYDASKQQACIADYKAASCATITGGTFSSGNCNSVCQ